MAINFRGYLFQDDGDAVSGATVQLLETGTTTVEASTTTDSDGLWYFNEGDQDRYDVKITSGTSVRYIRWDDQISLKELDVRNNTGNTTPATTFTNLTNNASNQVAVFSGANTTRADGDEIYLSFKLADSAGNIDEFARITAEAVDVTSGQEDGQLRFGVAKTDGTMTDVFTINSTTGGETSMTLDVSGDLVLDADGGDIFFKDGGTTFGSATNNSGNLIIKSGTTTALTFSGANVTGAGTYTGGGLMTTGGSIVIPDAGNIGSASDTDAIAISSGGVVTMNQIPVFSAGINVSGGTIAGTIATATQNSITTMTGLVTTGALASGTIASGFGTISTGNTITTTAKITGGELDIDDVIINGATIGHTDDTDLITLADGIATVAGEISVTTLDIGGTNISATAAEINLIDGGTARGTTAIADGDGVLINDDGTMRMTTVQTLAAYLDDEITAMPNLVTTGTIGTGVWEGTDVAVAHGGTGASSLTDGGVLLGSGTSAVTAMAVLSDGEMIVGDGTTDPVAESGATLRTSIGVGTGDSPQFTDLTLTDDLTLNSDSSVFNMGAGNDFTITHDGTTGATIAGNPVTITAGGASTWSTSSGALTITSAAAATWSTAAGALTIDGDDGITLQTTGSGNVTVSEILDITDATDSSDASGDTGALRTEGGASIAKKLYVGTDASVLGALYVGAGGNEFSITESSDDITIKSLISDKDLKISGNDGGSNVDALSFDMSASGAATFGGQVGIGVAPAVNHSLHLYRSGSNSSNLLRLENNDASSTAAAYWDLRHNDNGELVLWRASTAFMDFSITGAMFINETANTFMAEGPGLTINQGAADDEILTFKSSDVGHGMTNSANTEADTYGAFGKVDGNANSGGLQIDGYSEAIVGLALQGRATTNNTTDGTGARGAVEIEAKLRDGVTTTAYAAADNALVVRNNETAEFIVKGDGELYSNQSATVATFDEYDDARLARALDLTHGVGVIDSKFDDFIEYNHEKLADLKLVGRDEDGSPNKFVNITRMQRLHNGAIWQGYERQMELQERVEELETKLLALEGAK